MTQIGGSLNFFGANFHVLDYAESLKFGRKIVKNHGLTPLLFDEIF